MSTPRDPRATGRDQRIDAEIATLLGGLRSHLDGSQPEDREPELLAEALGEAPPVEDIRELARSYREEPGEEVDPFGELSGSGSELQAVAEALRSTLPAPDEPPRRSLRGLAAGALAVTAAVTAGLVGAMSFL